MTENYKDSSTAGSSNFMYNSNPSRLFTIDVLRGIAILGILLISIWEFGGYSSNEQLGLQIAKKGSDYYIFTLMQMLVEGKMRGILSLVFGAAILLFLSKPNHPNLPLNQELYIRKQMWLIAFGLINALVLLWPGDILYHYGIVGILLFPFLRLSKKGLLIAAMFATVIYCGKVYWNYSDDKTKLKKYKAVLLVEDRIKKDSGVRHRKDSSAGISAEALRKNDSIGMKKDTLTKKQKEEKGAWESLTKNIKYDSTNANGKAENKKISSGYKAIWSHLLQRTQNKESMWLYQIGVWDIASLMLLGMALFSFGFFSNDYSKTKYLIIAFVGIVLGIFLTYIRIKLNHIKLPDYEKYLNKYAIAPNQFFPLERVVMVIGYISLVLWFVRMNFLNWLWNIFAAVGKLAFTNYLIQTVVCTLFFYGYGFGYFGRLSLKELYFFVAEIWLVQSVFSIFWLRYYQYGPAEWLLRCLISAKRISNKKII
jgi:uncharacterized protein